jgi:uncharacterized protein (TIGR00661 family)
MNYPPPAKKPGQPRVLVAPLDWGLGHATRCIPVIYELLGQGAEVWLAGEGDQEILLNREFTNLPFLHLPGYRVKYAGSRLGLLLNLFLKATGILLKIKKENAWLKKTVEEYQFDAVVADNRFGLYHPHIPCVFITHQLRIKNPLGKWSERLLQKINYRYINRFTECWIPDEEKENGMAGDLSHPFNLPSIPCHYIGLLSRLKKNNVSERKNHLFISLSGPEPQRTILENIIINDIVTYKGTATIVRGLPGHAKLILSTNDIKFYNHLPTEEYSKEMQMADYVISRSGYSTVMDILSLGKKSILIPTPGQTEQEYLGKYLMQKKIAINVEQKKFSLNTALQNANSFEYFICNNADSSALPDAVSSFLAKLRQPVNGIK